MLNITAILDSSLRGNNMSLFETKDLVVTSALIAKCYDVSVTGFFIDTKQGKGITSAKNLQSAIDFAVSYQKLLG